MFFSSSLKTSGLFYGAVTACLAVLLTSCTQADAFFSSTKPAPSTPVNATPSAEPLPPTQPVDMFPESTRGSAEACPYLDTQFVADTNGERVLGIGLDERFSPPACIFWSYGDAPQLIVLVRHENSEDNARAVVDWAAPIDSTEPANHPAGWSGGRGTIGESGIEGYSVYAISKNNDAVVVFSDQEQTNKGESIAEETISRLGL